MLRIHFTQRDLIRTYLADTPDPLWEAVLSLQMLRARYGRRIFSGWRGQVLDAIRHAGQADMVKRLLFPLTPDASYFPDFLTPPEGLLGLDAGIETVLATPRQRLRHEVWRLKLPHPPLWMTSLASGDRDTLAGLGHGLSAYHRAALAPYWERMKTGTEIEHARRSLDQRTGGTAKLLAGLWPMMRWKSPVLEMDHPVDRDLRLNGRGLTLIPSYFCWHNPVPFADPGLPPTIVYPLRPSAAFLDQHPATAADPALANLIGPTRARILEAAAQGATTSELARRTSVSAPTVSQHAAVLRESGLITSHRHANAVVHIITPLGAALVGRSGTDTKSPHRRLVRTGQGSPPGARTAATAGGRSGPPACSSPPPSDEIRSSVYL